MPVHYSTFNDNLKSTLRNSFSQQFTTSAEINNVIYRRIREYFRFVHVTTVESATDVNKFMAAEDASSMQDHVYM